MVGDPLPVDLQKFIARHVESVEKLEILLLIGNSPEKAWSGQEVYQQIQSSPNSVNQKLKDLVAEGLAQREASDRFRFFPKTKELAEQVRAINEAYQTRRIKVIQSIFSESTEELRKFADAFRLKKEKE